MVEIISPTCQSFLGVRYWLCGFYFQRKGVRLHRTVWEHFNGPIPKGFHVHHINGDRGINGISNLELVEQSEHLSFHGKQKPPSATEKWRLAMQEGARRWHGSPAGRKWHSEHAKEYIHKIIADKIKKNCELCGKEFMAIRVHANRSKFCHPNCKAKALRKRRASA